MTARNPRNTDNDSYNATQGERDSDMIKLAVIQNDIGYIKDTVKGLDVKISTHYVSREEFEPIKKLVYGLVALILIAVVGAIVGLVIKPH